MEGDIDKSESSISPSRGEATRVQAVNKNRAERRAELDANVKFLNAKYPNQTFVREGSLIREIDGFDVPSAQGYNKNEGDSYLSKNEIPILLNGFFEESVFHEVFWDKERKNIVIKFAEVISPDKDYAAEAKQLLVSARVDYVDISEWTEQLIFKQLEVDSMTMRPQVAIIPSDKLLQDENYLRLEAQSHGRLYIRKLSNDHKGLLSKSNTMENTINVQGNNLSITLSKRYRKPSWGIFDEFSEKIMKKQKVIEGIESRLWHRYKVSSYRENKDTAFLELTKN